MAPGAKLPQFFVMKELNLIATRRLGGGHLWICEKKRSRGEVCPRCAELATARSGVAWTTVRDEAVRGMSITLRIKKHRYYCRSCRKPFTESVAGILPRRRTTQRLRKQVLNDCHDLTNLTKVARRHFISKTFVQKLFYEQMEIKLREKKTDRWPKVLGIDEHFFARKDGATEFTTVFTDVGRRKMFDMALSKNNASIIEQIAHIEGRESVSLVVMDLARGYNSLAKTLFPQARIVADKFHVLRLLTPALIKERRNIHGHRQELHLRRKLLRNRSKLDYFERCDLDRYLAGHPKLRELYHFKEKLHQLYRTKGYERARIAMTNLLEEMKTSSLEEIQRLRRTLKTWQEEVLEYFRSQFTNAFTESMNSIAKLVQRRGCGYRNFKNYRLRTLSACPL